MSVTTDPVRPDDAAAIAFAQPMMVVAIDHSAHRVLASLASRYYGFWNNGSGALFAATVSPDYHDHTLPLGRAQGPHGLASAADAFFQAFPDGRVQVEQLVLVDDRIVGHLIVSGTFTGQRGSVRGEGQTIEYRATDIMRVTNGLIAENWHVEDHEALHRQLAAG